MSDAEPLTDEEQGWLLELARPPSDMELLGWEDEWQRVLARDRGPAFTADARFGLRLIAEVRRLRALTAAAGKLEATAAPTGARP